VIGIATVSSPIGRLTIGARQDRVCLLYFGEADEAVHGALQRWYPGTAIRPHADPAGAATLVRSYFDGQLDALDALPLELNGTAFQKRVWDALRRVRAGTTSTYADLARAIAAPTAVRAVGAANGANPIAVIVPCHRIIGTSGSLTGYGGGLDRKRWLLEHEGLRLRFASIS
jgi:methylated-DNA-[protein]-cysteine S-methyltransferase